MEDRLKQLMNLQEFIKTNQNIISGVLKAIHWTEESTQKEFKDTANKEKIDNNITNKDDPMFPMSFDWPYSVTIDQHKLNSIIRAASGKSAASRSDIPNVPLKFSNMQTQLTREEKLEFYEYVIENADKPEEPPVTKSTHLDGAEKKMTFEEIIALNRNLKRRRLKHRTTKELPLSQTEEFRQLIDLQMQALIQYNETENCSKLPKTSSTTSPSHTTDDKNYYRRNKSKSQKERKKRSRSRERRPDDYRRHEKHKKRKRSRSSDGHRSREKIVVHRSHR